MATDREAVVWTRAGDAPMRMGRLLVTDTQSRFTYDQDFIDAGLPGIGALFDPREFGRTTIAWERNAFFDLHPQFQTLVPPKSEENFQRRLILAYLDKAGIAYREGFDTDWNILMVAGHGAIGHVDLFETDDKAREWYGNTEKTELFTIETDFGFSLKEFLTWMDEDAAPLLAALGPTPSVGGAVPNAIATPVDNAVALNILLAIGCFPRSLKIDICFVLPPYAIRTKANLLQKCVPFCIPRFEPADSGSGPVHGPLRILT